MANERKTETLRRPTISVARAHKFSDGTVTADLIINGVYIYGVKIAESKTGEFLAWPARKGRDERWYAHARAYLSDEDTAYAIRLIREELA